MVCYCYTHIISIDLEELADALPMLDSLEKLLLERNKIGPMGAQAARWGALQLGLEFSWEFSEIPREFQLDFHGI